MHYLSTRGSHALTSIYLYICYTLLLSNLSMLLVFASLYLLEADFASIDDKSPEIGELRSLGKHIMLHEVVAEIQGVQSGQLLAELLNFPPAVQQVAGEI